MQPADITARIAALTARADQLEARAAKRREAIEAEPAPVVKVRDGGAPAADAALSRATLAEDAAALGLTLSTAVVVVTPSPESLSESGEGSPIAGNALESASAALGVPDGRDSFHTPDSLPELAGTARAFAASRAPDLSPPGAAPPASPARVPFRGPPAALGGTLRFGQAAAGLLADRITEARAVAWLARAGPDGPRPAIASHAHT